MDDRPSVPSHDATAERHARLDALFGHVVAPRLDELAAMQRRWRLPAIAGGLGGPALFLLSLQTWEPLLLTVGAVAAILGPGLAAYLSRRFREAARDAITPAACRAIGGITHRVATRSGEITRLRRTQLVTEFTAEQVDDVFSGSHDGIAFTMMELVLVRETRRVATRAGRTRTETRQHAVFRGLFFVIATPAPVPVPILLRGRRRLFGTPWRRADARIEGLTRIDVPHEGFARHFTLWTTDWERAGRVVTPAFASILSGLAAAAGRRGIDAAFDRDQFLLLLPRGGRRFEVGGLFRSLRALRGDAHRLLDEILVIHRLIAALRGDGSDGDGPRGG